MSQVQSQPLIVYDDTCRLCTNGMGWVRALDWFRVFGYIGYHEALGHGREDLTEGGLERGLRVAFPNGGVTVGIDAVRSIAVRTPLGALPALLLYLPVVHAVARAAYMEIARHRPRTACAVHSAEVRRDARIGG